MPKEVSFVIRLDDKGTFKKVTVDAEELGRAVRSVQDESEKAKRTIISWSEVSQAFDVLQNAISELQGVMTDLTSAYQVQLVAETQLQTIMRQRMGANDEMIQSVKDLCSAQQELGVIGDEVQLSGAQQMATFLKSKQSLDVLIPAMNNLIAQQNGLNATNQDAVSIGNMMGKAMQGQVEVLQRVGITFTDAQKQVLQFGTESERAAMLAQVITDNVGNMNAELAKTDAGKWKQTENYLGDIKEQLGAMVQQYAPTITFLSQATIAASGIGKLATSFYSVGKAMGITKAIAVAWNAVCSTLSSTGLRLNAIIKVCSATMRGVAVSANTLKLAIQGLMISTGAGIAIVALTEAISAFMAKSDAAKLSAEEMADGMKSTGDAADDVKEAYDSSLKSTYSDLMAKYEKLKAGWKSLSTEQQKTAWIKQNQGAFHDLRLKINDVTEAENIFNKKTDAVVDAFKQRAMAAAYAAKLTALYQKQIALLDKKQKTTKDIADDAKRGGRNAKEGDLIPEGWRNERYGKVGNDGIWRFSKVGAERYSGTNTTGNKQVGGIDKELNSINRQIDDTQKQLSGRLKSASNFITADTPQRSTTPTKTTPSPKTDNTPKTHIEKLQDQLKKEQEKLGNATTIEAKIKADAKVKDIQGEIDEATKGKVTIGAQVDSSYIVQGSDADKRLSRNNAQQRIDRIKQDYDIGIVTDKTDAQRDIDDINKQLTEMGLKPIEVHWETHTEELQRQLQDAQREFDNATTIEAKLKASAKLADLQAQIDTETKGRLTIAADVDPSYIEQGSIADKRQSYSNAQTKASRIQQDFEIGIIGKDEAEKQIEDLNNQLSKLGKSVKPIKLDPSSMVKTDGFSKVMDNIKDGWGGIQGIGGGIQGITDALDGNKNAWQALSGVINGFISIAEGIQGIVQFVNMLTTATQAKSAATTADTAVTAANTAVTTTNTAAKAGEAITNVTASGAKLPFPANIAAIAAGVAAVVAALAMISGAFADGGVVGGNSPSGDKLLARVNSGEMILNAAQQARLFAIADGTAAYGASAQIAANFAQGVVLPSVSVQTDRLQGIMADGGGNQPKTVEWRLRGRDIVASIANETRSNRKRSNIRLK
jgi:hypothetical protein